MTPLLTAATLLSPFFPALIQWAQGENSEKTLQKVLHTASQLTQSSDPHQMVTAFTQNPELLFQFHKALLELEKEIPREERLDRTSARARDVALVQSGRQNLRADIMVIAAAMGLASCLMILGFYRGHLPGEAVGIISTVAGIFGSCLKDAYAFEFGSSRGSKDKDQHVQRLLVQEKR